jgi:hypothetical protein
MQIAQGSTSQIKIGVPCKTDSTAAVLDHTYSPTTGDFHIDGVSILAANLAADDNGNLLWTPTGTETAGEHQITCALSGYCMAPFGVEVGLPAVAGIQTLTVTEAANSGRLAGTYVAGLITDPYVL